MAMRPKDKEKGPDAHDGDFVSQSFLWVANEGRNAPMGLTMIVYKHKDG